MSQQNLLGKGHILITCKKIFQEQSAVTEIVVQYCKCVQSHRENLLIPVMKPRLPEA